ncbi:ATPase, T2SS/T4P/T4SS family [Erysipelothrix anatis]|uniref:ATPase, T2SS/T4P/T4SS family n=1 Tax=Erysipelothrix anatis TaxID=2683713 RepID=UPI00135B9B01|nr:ATPase, T2SS/T4P/T4SS family [Erysipelothrix anatis]
MNKIEIQFDQLIKQCVQHRISDIHIYGSESQQEIVLRKHKHMVMKVDDIDPKALFIYLKFIAGFDITNPNPQTKVFHYYIAEQDLQIRFAGIHNSNKYSGVARVLNINDSNLWADLCPFKTIRSKIHEIIQSNCGILLFVGRTGSGKSTSMFYALSQLKTKQIYTLENPVERINERWIQIDTECVGTHLTQLLRHDPDIIVLGELRTVLDISELIRAGLSGHMIVATMHASTLQQALRRLAELGASVEDLRELLEGVVLQEMKMDVNGEVKVFFEMFDKEKIRENL